MVDYGLGSTNLVSRPTGTAAELSRGELRAGLPRLHGIVRECAVTVVAYTGKGVYLAGSGRSQAEWGLQHNNLFPHSLDFVLPSPSGLVRMQFDEKLVWYRKLNVLLEDRASNASTDHCPLRRAKGG